ncbi:MAG: hypothetical protein LBS09_06860 [Bacteroidales bacterium]|jgi:hypothetical protein|nr:hypothetical protein [Bacteroidales bacterium]
MKKRFLIFAGIIAGIIFTVTYLVNRDSFTHYTWIPTFHTNDKQPYGCFVFDSLISASWEKGYCHTYKGIEDLLEGNHSLSIDANEANFLIIAQNPWGMTDSTVLCLLRHAYEGGNTIIATGSFPRTLSDTLNIDTYYLSETSHNVCFCPPHAASDLSFPAGILNCYFAPDNPQKTGAPDNLYRISETDEKRALSIRYSIGQGNLILICNPLIFTNYSILNDSISPYIWQHLGYLADRPLIRTEHYTTALNHYDSRSALTVLMDNQVTQWALTVLLLMLLTIMIFNARRKQKPIPIIHPPKNMMLDFVHSVTDLYLQKNNNADIIIKRKLYLSEEIKRKHGIDLINENINEICGRLAQKTGHPPEYIRNSLAKLNAVTATTRLSDKNMMALAEIIRQLATESENSTQHRKETSARDK